MKIAISVGHGEKIRGASATDHDPPGLDEVDEAYRAVEKIAEFLLAGGHTVHTFFDTVSTTQDANLKAITKWHNSIAVDDEWINCFVHLNAYTWTDGARGCECLYYSADEPLAFIQSVTDTDGDIFYPDQPPNTTGLARRLNSEGSFYVAVQWDYDKTPREELLSKQALVSAGDKSVLCWPADWGPADWTGRTADLSKAAMAHLGLETDGVATVVFPAPPAHKKPKRNRKAP